MTTGETETVRYMVDGVKFRIDGMSPWAARRLRRAIRSWQRDECLSCGRWTSDPDGLCRKCRGSDYNTECSVCGGPCVRTENSAAQIVCRSCRRERGDKRGQRPVPCHVCGVEMYSAMPEGVAAHYKCVRDYHCRVCGVEIVPGETGFLLCTTHYKNRDHIQRAEMYGVFWEDIDKYKVYRRDEWCCGICHLPVDRNLKYPDQMSASLDHIKPLSRGGAHTYANCQLAHWKCNVAKGNRDGGLRDQTAVC